MTAPSRGRDDATVRGAVVLVVAIVIGLALLWRSGADDGDAASADRETTTTTVFEGSTDSGGGTLPPLDGTTAPADPDDTRPPDTVAVIVFNGTPDRIPGIASEFTDKAAAEGYEALEPSDAATPTDTTTIYAAEGYELDAEAMKEVLDLPNAIVAAKTDEALGAGDDAANIVVVLGTDYSA